MSQTQAILSPAELLEVQLRRYATKKYDPAARIPQDVWEALEQSLLLTPSSYGLQPWKFLVVTDPEVRAKLRPVSWGQSQVEEASHFVVFLGKDGHSEADVDHFVARIAEVRGETVESLAPYKSMMMSAAVTGPRGGNTRDWNDRQVYIALGNFMTSAALLGVDTCPMEGLDPAAYDRILGLEGSGYHTVAACPAGYRAQDDPYAAKPKVRFPLAEVVETV